MLRLLKKLTVSKGSDFDGVKGEILNFLYIWVNVLNLSKIVENFLNLNYNITMEYPDTLIIKYF